MPKDKADDQVEVEDLLAFYETPEADEILEAIVQAAGKRAPKKLLDIAIGKRKSSDEQRGRAIYLLSRLGPGTAIAHIAKLTKDENALVRACAIRALPRLDQKQAQELLLEVVQDAHSTEIDVAHALASLREIGDLSLAAAIEDWAKQTEFLTLKGLADETATQIKGRVAIVEADGAATTEQS